jgi:N-acetyl sugar amidotransferase
MLINNPIMVDKQKYTRSRLNPEVFYGLPSDINYCKKCSYSNQKPNSEKEFTHTEESRKQTVAFNDLGICSACEVAEIKRSIDWETREKELIELCNRYRKNNGEYDCLVPGSGGKDSFYAAYVLKYKYGMNPLTVTWSPHIYTDWGFENFQSWIHAGFDNYLFTPNGRVHRLLTRIALEKLFHPFQPFMMGQMHFPPKIASKLGISLVFYGENPIEYGNKVNNGVNSPTKDKSNFVLQNQNDLYISGTSVQSLIDDFGISRSDLQPYLPISADELGSKDLNVQYLGYYLPWHPQDLYYFAVENGNFKASPERTSGTYSKYSSIDDKIDDFHYYCTYIKFGIGRATYDSAQEIRNGEITRDEAVSLIRKYDGEYPSRFENECFEYLSIDGQNFPGLVSKFESPIMDHEYFINLTNRFRSPHLWIHEKDEWSLRKQI